MDLLVMIVAGNITPWIFEQLKDAKWFPFMSRLGRYASILNKVTPFVGALLLSLGVTWTFEAVDGGRFIVEGFMPTPEKITKVIVFFLTWLMQTYRYHMTVHPNAD